MLGGLLRTAEDRLADAEGRVLGAIRQRDDAIAERDNAREAASLSLLTSQSYRRDNLDLQLQLAQARQGAALPVQLPVGVRVGTPEELPPPMAREEK